MSYINVMLVKDNKVYFFSCHYRTLLAMADKSFEKITELCKRQNFLDAGWFVFDYDKNLVVSRQTAFPAGRFKDMSVFEAQAQNDK